MPVLGQLNEIDVPSLLQMLCVGNRQSVLRLEGDGEEGTILIDRGHVTRS